MSTLAAGEDACGTPLGNINQSVQVIGTPTRNDSDGREDTQRALATGGAYHPATHIAEPF